MRNRRQNDDDDAAAAADDDGNGRQRPRRVRQKKQLVVSAARPLQLLVATLVLATFIMLQFTPNPQAEAKIHHSKRQVPASADSATSAFQSTSGTGRESTNWWNIWWQQYINEAAQPTVRPIVAVSFNGRTINLSDQQQQQIDIDPPVAPQVKSVRRATDRTQPPPPAALAQEDTNVFMDKQMLLAHRKQLMQHQMHWQSVKPTIIQTAQPEVAAPGQRDARTNRQASSADASNDGLGIQMRASMGKQSTGKPNLNRVASAARKPNSPAQNLFQQQQQQQMVFMEELGGKFEQQQNQMIDYSEENDDDAMPDQGPDEMPNNVRQMQMSGGDETSGGSRGPVDSSSSSMMQELKPNLRVSPGMRQPSSDASSVNQMMQGRQEKPRTIIMMGMGPQSIMTPQVVPGGSAPRTTTTSTTTTTGSRQPTTTTSVTTTTPVSTTTSSSGSSSAGTTESSQETGSGEGRQQVASTKSSVPPSTTTLAPTTTTTTTTTTSSPTTTTRSDATSQTDATKTTQATSRVQLENGRPASGLNKQQQATTNAARPPTLATPSRTETPTTTTTTTTLPPSTTTAQSSSTKNAQTTTTTTSSMETTTTLRPTTSGSTRTESRGPTSTSLLPEPTTTLRPMSANDTSDASGDDGEGEEGDDEEVGSEPQSGTGGGNSTSLMNANEESTSGGGDDEDDEEDSTGADVELTNQTTTMATPASGAPTGSARQQQQQQTSGGGMGSMMAFTTQQPSMTTIDIERLPKGGATSTTAAAASTTTAPPTTTTTTTTTTAPTTTTGSATISPLLSMTPEDINRIRTSMAGSGGQLASQEPSANVVMMTIGQNNRQNMDEEMAITMPMEALMKMMNQVVQENETRLQAGSSPAMSSMADETTTTTNAPTTTTTSSSSVAQTTTTTTSAAPSTTTGSGRGQESSTSERPLVSSMMANQPAMDEETMISAMGDQMQPLMGRKKLPGPPPPTPRTETTKPSSSSSVNQQMQTSFIDSSMTENNNNNKMTTPVDTSGSTSPAGPQKETMFSMMEPVSVVEEANGQREPKIELLNLDLMPIQRIMNNQMMMSSQMSTPSKPRERLTAPEVQAMSNNNRQVAPAGEPATNNQMEQVVIADVVEPGMRLKPIKSMSQQQQQQQRQLNRDNSPIIMSDMMSNKNKANTVYMIMMNGQSAPGDSAPSSLGNRWSQSPTTMTTKSAPTTGSRQATSKAEQDGQMSMMGQQSRATSPAATGGSRTSTTRNNNAQQTMTTPAAQMPTSGSTRSSPTGSMSQQQQMMMIQMSLLNQSPSSTTTTASTTTTTTARPASEMDTMRQQQLATTTQTTAQPSTTSGSSLPKQTSTTKSSQQETNSQDVSVSSMSSMSPMSTIDQQREDLQRGTTTTTTSSPLQTTTAATTSAAPSTTSTTTTTTAADNNQFGIVLGNRERGGGKLDKLQQQSMQPEGGRRSQGTKSGGSRVNKINTNNSGTFIPNKLRSDFQSQKHAMNRQHVAQASSRQNQIQAMEVSTTTQLPLTGMAIRQFGGANRMSVLGQQPVPFGRPAAMTMPMRSGSSATSRGSGGSAPEVASFEYGPSIAVRRPDEPLANGQMPNCTLTGKNFCVLTKDYPMNEVRQAVERSFRSVRIMYEELQTVSDQELHKDDFNATNNQAASGKFACQTQVEMMRPGWAKDEITKEWMLVVNTDVFPQRVRSESCAQPNTPCEFIAPFYDSTCQQRYSLHRMIAIDPNDPSRSPQVAVFRFPAGCVCRVHPIRKAQPTTSATTPSTTTLASTSSSSSRLMGSSRRRRR